MGRGEKKKWSEPRDWFQYGKSVRRVWMRRERERSERLGEKGRKKRWASLGLWVMKCEFWRVEKKMD